MTYFYFKLTNNNKKHSIKTNIYMQLYERLGGSDGSSQVHQIVPEFGECEQNKC